ncbi:helix-turn-helix transcriptional regulator [Deinococcus enclensis]|uniref:Transcriptional regulator with XRE-family HTH domain n=1 Tax=Deinococcus enclensis TaxID=1049582 RepID=A0ABT9MIT6_9DEIO|nr:helix-turn-helix transcriptional regulator [Deinococcus enclensis]MDP9766109.1 transcriptional regulator with XRE-family HTH domain [Deinococcus enclensis]
MADTTKKRTLAQWREESGKTVQEMADALGVTRGHMGDYLQGRAEPSVTRGLKMAAFLGVPAEAILWTEKPKVPKTARVKSTKAGAEAPS